MTLKDTADLATSLTLIVAAITFMYTVIEHNRRARRQEIQDWQKVVVYRLIEVGATNFKDISTQYVIEAQKYSDLTIPKKAIQDIALRRLLLSLVEARLIATSGVDTYVAIHVSAIEERMKQLAFAEFEKRNTLNNLLSKIFQTLENDNGKYVVDQLYRTVKAVEFGYNFEDFDILIRDQINRGTVVSNSDGKLFSQSRLAQQPPSRIP